MNKREEIIRQLEASAQVKQEMVSLCADSIEMSATLLISALKDGHKVLWVGNGSSAGQAQHLSTELIGGLRDHTWKGSPSISLTVDSSFITAWANDVGFDSVFSQQVGALGMAGDVLVAISTSGNSVNVIEAVKKAQTIGMKVIVFTGNSGGFLKPMGDVVISIPSDDCQRIQEGHILAGHIMCELVEMEFIQ
jgi:D-sedoheptulose 7-phosphate isomerase